MSYTMGERLVYIDWMKIVGIYFIIAGHMFSSGHEYLYTFSVPLFFLVSGLLFHFEAQWTVFWKKLFHNLIIPMILICFIILSIESIGRLYYSKFDWSLIFHRLLNIIMGMHGKGVYGGGLGVLWFVYTLIICKVIQQFIYHSKALQVIALMLCVMISCYYNEKGVYVYNSWMNVTLAYPFFWGGWILSNHMKRNDKSINITRCLITTLVGCVLVAIVTPLNGSVRMYGAIYGNNILLFLSGSLAGTISVYAIALLLSRYNPNLISLLSRGMIIILGFHNFFLMVYKNFLRDYRAPFIDYICSLLILLMFIPIIKIAERWMPALMGMRVKTYKAK